MIKRPRGLCATAKTEFERIAPELERAGYNLLDEALLRAYLAAYVNFRRSTSAINREGQTITLEDGKVIANPMLLVQRQSIELLNKLANQLMLGSGVRKRARLDLSTQEDEELV